MEKDLPVSLTQPALLSGSEVFQINKSNSTVEK